MAFRFAQLAGIASLCPRDHGLPTGESSLDLQWRLAVFDALRKGDARYYDQCNLGELLQQAKVFTSAEKASASDAIIVAGQLRPPNDVAVREQFAEQWAKHKCDILLKASFPRLYQTDRIDGIAPLDAEVILYEFLDTLVRQRVTPNLVVALGTFDCTVRQLKSATPPNIVAPFIAESRKVFQAQAKQLNDDDPVRFLVLERGRGETMQKMLDQRAINEPVMISLLAQIIYTVMVLHQRNIRHADLHLNNVFVDRLSDRGTTINYLPDPGSSPLFLAVPTYGFVAKLYDWDRGGVYDNGSTSQRWPRPQRQVANSISLDYCPTTSACGSNAKADIFTPLSILFYTLATDGRLARTMPQVARFITDVIDERLLRFAVPASERVDSFVARGGFPFRLCRGPLLDACTPLGTDNRTDQRCSGAWQPADCLHKSPQQMLQHPIFRPFVRTRGINAFVGPHVYGNWPTEAVAKQIL